MLESLATSEAGRYAAGIIGSVLSLQYASNNAPWYEKALMSFTGVAAAIYLAPATQYHLGLTDDYTYGLAFVFGMYGWSLTGGLFKLTKSEELKNAILDRIRGGR